jgi:hypothetical protein
MVQAVATEDIEDSKAPELALDTLDDEFVRSLRRLSFLSARACA